MNRSTVMLIALLLILGAIALFVLPSGEERESSDKTPVISFTVDSASIAKIEILRTSSTVTIENIGGRWMMTSPARYQVDASAVKQLLGGFSRLKIGSLISSNPEKQHLFQVDSSGTSVVLTERSGKAASIVIGKMGPSFSEVYLRLPDSKDVYLASGIDTWTITREVKDWRDRTILSIPAEGVKSLTYASGSRQYEFRRDKETWKSGEKSIGTDIINPPLTTLANLKADDFVDSTANVRSNPMTLTVQGIENASLTLFPILPDSSKYYVLSSASPQWFVINKSTAQQLLRPLEANGGAIRPAPRTVADEIKPKPVEKKTSPPPAVVSRDVANQKLPPASEPRKKAEVSPPPIERVAPPVVKEKKSTTPPHAPPPQERTKTSTPAPGTSTSTKVADDDGELTVHAVKRGETMQSIATKYMVTVEQILKWNLMKSVYVKPGQELYIFIKK